MCYRVWFLSLWPSHLVCICSTCGQSAKLYMCAASDQVPEFLMGFQAAAQAGGKIRFLGGFCCRQGPLCPPPQACGEERRRALSGQHKAGWVYSPSPSPFFTFLLCFTFFLPGRTVWANPCCAPLHTGSISLYATLNICMFPCVCVWVRVDVQVENNSLSLSGAK